MFFSHAARTSLFQPFLPLLFLLTIITITTLSPTLVQAQYSCDNPPPDFECQCPQFQETLQCKVCGFQGSSPFRCFAYNSSFDDIPKNKPVANYSETTWDYVLVAGRGPANPIVPSSPKHYLRSTSGCADVSFTSASPDGFDFGNLYSFSYACADPCGGLSSQKPVACNVAVTAGCLSTDEDGNGYVFYYNDTFTYDPAGARWGSMAQGVWNSNPALDMLNSSLEYYFAFNWNFTFEATMADGKPAFLYLDDVVTNIWYTTGN